MLWPFCRGFKRPSTAQSRAAIDTPRVPAPPAIAALRDSSACPPPVPTPTCPDDWLAQYVEPGQTMAEFLSQCPWLSRRKRKYYCGEFHGQGSTALEKYPEAKICLLPLGDIRHGPSMEALRKYTEAFYRGIEVCVLPPIDVDVPEKSGQPVVWRDPDGSTVELPHRRHGKKVQLQIDGVLLQLRSVQVKDALMVVAVTMHELFDGPTDLFVAGMASGLHNVAVYSARQVQCVWVTDFLCRHEAWTEWAERIEHLGATPLRAACFALPTACRDIVRHCVPLDIAQRALFGHILRRFANNHG